MQRPALADQEIGKHRLTSEGVPEGEPIGRLLYDELCRVTGTRHDPCVLDVFLAAVRFMEGKPAKPWWAYTAERKRELAKRGKG